LPKLEAPLPNRFIGDDNPALCEKLLDITLTERKAEIQPDSVTDSFGWEKERACFSQLAHRIAPGRFFSSEEE
jgi:hypothetical protein